MFTQRLLWMPTIAERNVDNKKGRAISDLKKEVKRKGQG
jgi:hypothetical protein